MENIHTISLFCYVDKFVEDIIRKRFQPIRDYGRFIWTFNHSWIKLSYYPKYRYLYVFVKGETMQAINDIHEFTGLLNDVFISIFGVDLQIDLRISRIDYKHDLYLSDQIRLLYLKLLKKGYVKFKHLNQNSRYESSLYFKSGSLKINIYDKERERQFRLNTKNINNSSQYKFLRFEIQLLRSNIRQNVNRKGIQDELSYYFSNERAKEYLHKYLSPLLMEGDYYKLYHAKINIEKKYPSKTSSKLLDFMAFIGRHGLQKAKDIYGSKFYDYKSKLEGIRINPIPIPKNIKSINMLPSILKNRK